MRVKLDDRAGSKELYSPLLMVGLQVDLCRLPFGDVAFDGMGKDDIPVLVGIEHKRVSDVIQCIENGRFAGHQLPGLAESYNHYYLMVEGEVRAGSGGVLEELHRQSGRYHVCGFGNRTFRYSDYVAWLTTMRVKGGVDILTARTQMDSVHTILGLVGWWTKGYEHHRSHLAFDLATDAGALVANLIRPNLVRRMAKELPGVGWEKSKDIAAKFPTVIDMAGAEESEWREIPGIGKGIAAKIRKELGWPEGDSANDNGKG